MPEIDVIAWTDAAFSQQGAVYRILGEHRPMQGRAAHAFAATMVSGTQDSKTIAVLQASVGLGKTLAAMIPAALVAISTGERVIIATCTKALRQQIADVTPVLNRILEELFAEHGMVLPRPIRVAERKAISGYVSPPRVDAFTQQVAALKTAGMVSHADIEHAEAFIDYLSSATELAPWFEMEVSEGRFPFGLTEFDFAMDPSEIEDDHGADYREMKAAADAADILVVTHTMVLMDTAMFGRTLDTARDAERGVCSLIVDEAHQFPLIAQNRATATVTLDTMTGLVPLLTARGYDTDVLADAIAGLVACIAGFDNGQPVRIVNAAPEMARLFVAVSPVYDALVDVQGETMVCDDVILTSHVEQAMNGIVGFMVQNRKAGSSNAAFRAVQDSEVLIRYVETATMPRPASIAMVPRYSAQAINRLWRTSTHGFRNVLFMSGTLSDINGSADLFLKEIGISQTDRVTHRVVVHPPLEPSRYGRIDRLVFPARDSSILPSLAVPNANGDYTNPEHIRYVATAVRTAFAENSVTLRRIAVLFRSQRALDMVAAHLRASQLGQHLVIQSAGVPWQLLVPAFRADPCAIWLGLNWEGMNLVDNVGRSLIRTVMLSCIPMTPSDTLHAHACGPKYAAMINQSRAWRKIEQGVGRGIRHPDDVIDLWILDPRWPLVADVVESFRANSRIIPAMTPGVSAGYGKFGWCLPERVLGPNEPDDAFAMACDGSYRTYGYLETDGRLHQIAGSPVEQGELVA